MSRLRIIQQTRDLSGQLLNIGDEIEANGYFADQLVRDGTAERLEVEAPPDSETLVPNTGSTQA